jgi:Uma2 family endonuclease
VPEVWIVNLVARTIDVFRKPNEAGYGETQTLKRGESVAPSAFPELTVAVNDILG